MQADGHINQQSSSYRRGLVLGLTMAEIMLLLVFCLLIAMTTFLKTEQDKLAAVQQELLAEREAVQAMREAEQIKPQASPKIPPIQELPRPLQNPSVASSTISEYWTDLVDGAAMVAEAKRLGLTQKEMKDRLARAPDPVPAKPEMSPVDRELALRNAEIVGAIGKVMPDIGSKRPDDIAAIIQKGLVLPKPDGHKWPPIINLSDAAGYNFEVGSAELSPEFKLKLGGPITRLILDRARQYDTDVIEVVGHTDEQPIGLRPSNLDTGLVPVLNGTADVASLVPADNAGLGLARAVSVVGLLRQNPQFSQYKLLPLSGAQLINNNGSLATTGIPADLRQRRRIEIRLRKSTPLEISASVPAPVRLPSAPDVKPVQPPKPQQPSIFFPFNILPKQR